MGFVSSLPSIACIATSPSLLRVLGTRFMPTSLPFLVGYSRSNLIVILFLCSIMWVLSFDIFQPWSSDRITENKFMSSPGTYLTPCGTTSAVDLSTCGAVIRIFPIFVAIIFFPLHSTMGSTMSLHSNIPSSEFTM